MYWLKAGQQALGRSAMTEAVIQLRKGLDLLAGLPDSPWRRQHELDLQIALRPALAATKSFSAAAVGRPLTRASALAEQINRPEYPLLSSDCPRRLAARISEPCGVHLPELADIFVKKAAG